jgi:acyl transferase domain-containing protein
MVIEDPPLKNSQGTDLCDHHVVTISGRTLVSFEQNRARLLEYLRTNGTDVDLASLAYTTTARRQHHVFRRAYSSKSMPDLISMLEDDEAAGISPTRVSRPKASFVFTGQGSHYSGMGKQLFETNRLCRQWFIECNSICTQQGFPPFLGLITGDLRVEDTSPSQTQLAIVSFELVMLKLWNSWGLEPDIVLGHSLGEYAALVASGVLSAYDMLYLVGSRAQLMEQNCTSGTHAMLDVKLSADEIVNVLNRSRLDTCEVTCINGPQSTVVSGNKDETTTLQNSFASEGVKALTLHVPFAFHSGQMDAILDDYEAIALLANYSAPVVPIASPLTGGIVRDAGAINAK